MTLRQLRSRRPRWRDDAGAPSARDAQHRVVSVVARRWRWAKPNINTRFSQERHARRQPDLALKVFGGSAHRNRDRVGFRASANKLEHARRTVAGRRASTRDDLRDLIAAAISALSPSLGAFAIIKTDGNGPAIQARLPAGRSRRDGFVRGEARRSSGSKRGARGKNAGPHFRRVLGYV